jgi:hypothetical protein
MTAMSGADQVTVGAEQEDSYLKLLRGLAQASRHGAESSGVVRRIATWIEAPAVLEVIAAEPAWYARWSIKEALIQNPSTGASLRARLEPQIAVLDLLRELDGGDFPEAERAEILEDVRSLIAALAPADRRAVREQALKLSASRQKAASAPAPSVAEPVAPAPAPSVAEVPAPWQEEDFFTFPEPVYEDWTEEGPAAEPQPAPGGSERQAAAGRPGSEREVEQASTSADPTALVHLAYSHLEAVQLALVANQALPEAAAVILARQGGMRAAEAVYRRRDLFARPKVRSALLENPQAPAVAQLQAVDHLSDLPSLARLLASPRVRHLEVKSKARSRLRERFVSLSEGERAATVRQGGRALLRHLWSDFFRDEALVLRCLREKQLDEGVVLEVARSKISPRRALEEIGKSPAWTARYPILLALVSNPKTPRQIAQKLLPKLTPADRKSLKHNPAVAESVRRLA